MKRDDLLAIFNEPNVRAFSWVVRHCEGTQSARGYTTIYGYQYFTSFADHPRRKVTAGGRTSSAAGAYQYMPPTWDELRVQYALPDFSPESQDAGFVALLIRRKALDAVRAGEIDDAVRLCNREWASLPGSPYGQPVRTLEYCRSVFAEYGGWPAAPIENRTAPPTASPQPAQAPAAPPDDPTPIQPIADAPAARQESRMAPILAALLPSLVSLIPEIGKLFGDGPKTERNTRVAEKVAEIVVAATGAPNLQGAVEQMERDPSAVQAARQAVQSSWYEIVPADGGGIEGARAAATQATAGSDWKAIGYGATLALLALLIVGGGGAMMWALIRDPLTTPEQRGMLIGAIVALIGTPVAFFFGSSVSSRSKDSALVNELGKRQP